MTAELLHYRELGRTSDASSKIVDARLQFQQSSDFATTARRGASSPAHIDGNYLLTYVLAQTAPSGFVTSGKLCNGCITISDRREVILPKATEVSTSSTSLTQRIAGFDRLQYEMLPSDFTDTTDSESNLIKSAANNKVSVLLPAMFGGDQEWQTLSNFTSGGHNDSPWDEIYRPRPLICLGGDSATNSSKFQEDLRGYCLGSTECKKPGWKANTIWNTPVSRHTTTKEDYNNNVAAKASTVNDSAADESQIASPAHPTYYHQVNICHSFSAEEVLSGIDLRSSTSKPSINDDVYSSRIADYSRKNFDNLGLLPFSITGRKRSSFEETF